MEPSGRRVVVPDLVEMARGDLVEGPEREVLDVGTLGLHLRLLPGPVKEGRAGLEAGLVTDAGLHPAARPRGERP